MGSDSLHQLLEDLQQLTQQMDEGLSLSEAARVLHVGEQELLACMESGQLSGVEYRGQIQLQIGDLIALVRGRIAAEQTRKRPAISAG